MNWRGRITITHALQTVILVCVLVTGFQVLLLMCDCKCKSSHKDSYMPFVKNEPYLDPILGKCERLLRDTSTNLSSMVEQIADYEKKLKKYENLNRLIVSEELNNIKGLVNSDILRTYSPKSEFHVIPFESFTANYLYGDIGYQEKKPSAHPIGQRAKEQKEIFEFAIRTLNEDVESRTDKVNIQSFAEGFKRNDKLFGTVYDLYFTSRMPQVFKRLKLIRPFDGLQVVGKPETIDTSKEWINLIVPLSGKLDTLELFMQRFVETCIRQDRRIYLTVVYFGMDGRQRVREIISRIAQQENYDQYKVVYSKREFSRGMGLQMGAKAWENGNVLLFFCDVDIFFTLDYFDRCRLNTSPGKKVYYPIVFSQYNPAIIYGGAEPPPLQDQMYIHKDNGFWRDFGFGMTCQYRSDFLDIGGFDLSIRGWGGEDVDLYKRHLKGKLNVVRAYDRGLVHIYHPKSCIRTLSDNQFVSCLQSKAVSEGSHKQLGMLAFGSSLVTGKDPDWKSRLQESLNSVDKQKSQLKVESTKSPSKVPRKSVKVDEEKFVEAKDIIEEVKETNGDKIKQNEKVEMDNNGDKAQSVQDLTEKSDGLLNIASKLDDVMKVLKELKGEEIGVEGYDQYLNDMQFIGLKLGQKSVELKEIVNQKLDGG